MTRRNYPSRVGRPAQSPKCKYSILLWRRCKFGRVALIQRARPLDTSFAVVRSKLPILPNGTLLRALDAVPFKAWPTSGQFCKGGDAEAWHSRHPDALAKFHSLLQRGGK